MISWPCCIACLTRLMERRPQLVIVEGAAGVGKSALLRGFAQSVDDRVIIMRASGDKAEQHLDYGLIEQLHADGEASDLPVRTMFGRTGPRPDPLDVGADVVRVSSEASSIRPIVALIDDAQWATGPRCRRLPTRYAASENSAC